MSTQKTNHDSNDRNVAALQDIMFNQMKRLADPDIDLDKEVKRSQALTGAATVVINAAKVQIDAARVHIQRNKIELPGAAVKIKHLSNGK